MKEEKNCDNCGNKRTACSTCFAEEFEGQRTSDPSNWIPEKPEKKKLRAETRGTIIRALGWLEGISYCVQNNLATGIIDAVQAIEESLKEIV